MKTAIFLLVKTLIIQKLWITIFIIPSLSQQKPLGLFDSQSDVGKVSKPSSTRFDAEKDEYTIEGSGANIWADHDDFHLVWQRLKDDFILTTRAKLIGKGEEAHRKIGWMVRSSLYADSAQVSAVVHGDVSHRYSFDGAKAARQKK